MYKLYMNYELVSTTLFYFLIYYLSNWIYDLSSMSIFFSLHQRLVVTIAPKNETLTAGEVNGIVEIVRGEVNKVTFANPELENAVLSIVETEVGIAIVVNAAQLANAKSSIVVTELGTVIDVNPELANTP